MDQQAVIDWVLSCRITASNGGTAFGGSPRNDPHLLYTLSAVQILALYDRLDLVDADDVAKCECLKWAQVQAAASELLTQFPSLMLYRCVQSATAGWFLCGRSVGRG